MVKVSFVVAIYNVGKFLDQCVKSLVEQNMDEVEIILVNDGSTDNSLEICRRYEKKDPRVRVIDQPNQGANAARNTGLRAAAGKWVYFVDGDDFVAPDVCSGIAEYLDEDYDVILCGNSIYDGKKINDVHYCDKTIELFGDDFTQLQLADLNRIGDYKYNMTVLEPSCIWNKIYNCDFLNRNQITFVPGFPKLQDVAFNLLVYDKAVKGIYVPHAGYCYRINSESVTRRYQSNIIEKFEVVNAWFESFTSAKKDVRFQKAFWERVTTHIRTCIVLYLCNANNHKSFRERRAAFRVLRASEPYKTSVDATSIFAFRGVKERVLAFAVKYKLFVMCELLCRLNDIVAVKGD